MPLHMSVFYPKHSNRNSSQNDLRLNVQHPTSSGEAEGEANARPQLVKCPELSLTGFELETRTTLRILHKKGWRFDSPWKPYFVGIYANTLFYFTDLGDWPRGVVPLFDAEIKAVDRIYRHGDAASVGDDCGPCWKLTSSSGRTLLFRAPSHDARSEWVDQLRQATGTLQRSNMDGKAALALARRLSRSSSSVSTSSTSSTVIMQSPSYQRRNFAVEDDFEQTDLLRDALRVVEKQRKEINELQERLKESVGKMMHHGDFVSQEEREMGVNAADLERHDEQVEELYIDDAEIDLDMILEEPAIEICKSFRGSTISDVLSEDDMLSVEDVENDQVDEEDVDYVDYSKGEEGRENVQNLSLVDESMESDSFVDIEENINVNDRLKEMETERCSRYEIPASSVQVSESDNLLARSRFEHATILAPNSTHLVNVPTVNKEDLRASLPLRALHKQSPDLAASFGNSERKSRLKKSFSSIGSRDFGVSADNGILQQQAVELAEFARNLQSSFQPESEKLQTSLKSPRSSLPLFECRSSFSDVYADGTDFGLNQINSNSSDESIFSITQDDFLYGDNDEGDIERLSEFEESDGHFLEASGFQGSIHQVMQDVIVPTQSDRSIQPDQLVIGNKVIAEICQKFDAEPAKEVDDAEADSPSFGLLNSPNPRKRSFLSHARSARGFFSGDNDVAPDVVAPQVVAPQIVAPQIILPQNSKKFSLLVVEDTMSVVASILQNCGRKEKVMLLAPLLRVFGSHNRLSHLIRWAIEMEVASVINVATLFRSDDYASRLVSTYSKAIGSKFIRAALSDPIRQIYKLKIADVELNPYKNESHQDETRVNTNAVNLMQTCQDIIDSIMKNVHYIPTSYYHICSHLNAKVISRFDGTVEGIEAEDASMLTRAVIGGFLFLRFVCPAITTPHLYGLTKQLPPPETRRVLVLVTKLLFKTATGVKFGDREPHFKVLNPFIENNSPAIQQLFAELAMSPSHDIEESFALDSRKIYWHVPSSRLVDDLELIRSISENNLEEIGIKLKESNCPTEVAEDFKTALLYTTDTFQKSSLSKKLSANMKFLSNFGRTRKEPDQ